MSVKASTWIAIPMLLFGCGGLEDGSAEQAELAQYAKNATKKPVEEVVKCVFEGSRAKQSCHASIGQSCEGSESCAVTLKGHPGEKVRWKSTCGGYQTTVMDGRSETIAFKCAMPPKPPLPRPEVVREVVTCYFGGGEAQVCYSSGGHSCKGVGSCTVEVWGFEKEELRWKSSCGGYQKTLLDGQDERIGFRCGAKPPPVMIREKLTCVFDSSEPQSCRTSTGQGCKGIGRCETSVQGQKGETVMVKSSCGGEAKVLLDGKGEVVKFDCRQAPPKPPVVREVVTCYFDSKEPQGCWALTRAQEGCKGIGRCAVKVGGSEGDVLTWTSSCGGEAKTQMDGKDEAIKFDCSAKPEPPKPEPR